MSFHHPFPCLFHLQSTGCIPPAWTRQQVTSWTTSQLSLSRRSLQIDRQQHSAGITGLAVDNEEGRYLLAGAGDGSIYLRDLGLSQNDCQMILSVGRGSRHSHSHSINTVNWGMDTGMFLSSASDGRVKIWDTNTGKPVDQFSVGKVVHSHAMSNSEVGSLVGVASDISHVTLIDLRSGSTSHVLRGHTSQVISLAWHLTRPNILATGGSDCKVNLWDVRQSRSLLHTLDYNNVRYKKQKDLQLSGMSHTAPVLGTVFTKCGRYLLSVGADRRIRRWDSLTWKNLKTKFPEMNVGSLKRQGGRHGVDIDCSAGGLSDCLFIPEGRDVQSLDISTGQTVTQLSGNYGPVLSLSYNQVRYELYTGGSDRNILVYDSRDCGEVVKQTDDWTSEEDEEL